MDALTEIGAGNPRGSVSGHDLEMNATVNYYSSLITRKAKTAKCLLASGDLCALNVGFKRNMHIIWNRIRAIPYFVFADLEDWRYGGKCTNRTIATKYYDQGAHALQNSDYRCIEQLFEAVPLRPDDVFVDVGSGEGRVLTYHDRHGFRGRLIDNRPGWHTLWRGKLTRPPWPDLPATIYEYNR